MDRKELLLSLIFGFLLDQVLGDPQGRYHPVRLLGRLIGTLEACLYGVLGKKERALFWEGVLLAAGVCGAAAFFSWGILRLGAMISPIVHFLISSLMCYFLFAVKDLRVESMRVYDALKDESLEKAREAVSMIVGRDVNRLDQTGVAKAAIETVAENTSDGVVAPLLYMAVGGPVLGWVYKAVNTMDSMVGYKNERYLYFGRAAARLDDVLNWLPSRLSALLMILSAFLLHMDAKNALRIFLRDRFCHASPNSAQTEAACAGALGIELAGDAWYFGILHKKKTIGDALRPVEYEDIRRANWLMYGVSYLALGLAALGELCLILFW